MMKNIFNTLLLSTAIVATVGNASGQDTTSTGSKVNKPRTNDEILPNKVLDINFKYGGLSQKWNYSELPPAYTDIITSNSKFSGVSFAGKNSVSCDIQLGYFFGKKHIIGIGGGVMYQQTTGEATLDTFHVEYKRPHEFGGEYRQIITAVGPVKEAIQATNISVPVMLKLKHQFKNQLGVFADVGGLFSVVTLNKYDNGGNATFDYEAIYKFDNNGMGLFDSVKRGNEWLVTRAHYNFIGAEQSVIVNDFNTLNSSGYNVKLDSKPIENKGTHSYKAFAAGFLLQGGFSYQLNYRLTANIGGYYLTQTFKNKTDVTDNWRLTDKVGEYNSLLNGVRKNTSQSYGITVGVRYFIGKDRDEDGDGLPDKKDGCPKEFGPAMLGGCPDTDNDGIPDRDDHCVTEPGVPCTEGCPDADEDCVPDKFDQCPDEPVEDIEKSMLTLGCPDRDGDGQPDKEDECPDVPGLKRFGGCPDKSYFKIDTVVADPEKLIPDHIVLSKRTIYFKTGKSEISDSTYPALNEVVQKLKEDKRMIIYISGHTDNTGGTQQNMMLSFYRADEVKKYIVKQGIAANRILISGMGKKEPILPEDSPENKAKNNTPEYRAKNRRIEMRLLLPIMLK